MIEFGGEASVWLADTASSADDRRLAERMSAAVAEEYAGVAADARTSGGAGAVRRLRRRLRAIRSRDFFPPAERAEAEAAVERLAANYEATL